jgi:hypothetical protein
MLLERGLTPERSVKGTAGPPGVGLSLGYEKLGGGEAVWRVWFSRHEWTCALRSSGGSANNCMLYGWT